MLALMTIVLLWSGDPLDTPPPISWQFVTDYPAAFYSVRQAMNLNFAVAGIFGNQACLFMFNAAGDTLWKCVPQVAYAPGTTSSMLLDVRIAPGGYITCGRVETSSNGNDLLVMLVSQTGDIVWENTYSTPTDEGAFAAIPLASGGFAVAGYKTYASDWHDLWLFRLSASGDTLWTVSHHCSNSESGRGIEQRADGTLLVMADAGRPMSHVYDLDGNRIHSFYYYQLLADDATGFSLAPDEGGYVVSQAMELGRIEFDLHLLWFDMLQAAGGYNDLYGVCTTMDGGCIAVGAVYEYNPEQPPERDWYNWDGYTYRVNPDGSTLWWERIYDAPHSFFRDVIQISGGGYLIVGCSDNNGLMICYDAETGIETPDESSTPSIRLQPSCNPFSEGVTITCLGPSLPSELMVYSITGRLIRSLSNSQGSSFLWDGRDESGADVPVGTYLIQGAVDGQASSIRLIRL